MPHEVMIIDDSPLERLMTETLVKRSLPGGQIISFSSAGKALDHLRSLCDDKGPFPKVIFLDIHMPVVNGFDFLDEYIRFPEEVRKNTKIIMFSSTENDEDHARMRTYPVIHKFLSKPLYMDAIEQVSPLWK